MGYLTREPIDVAEWRQRPVDQGDGAAVEFLGIVRGEEQGQPVRHLEYEAYEPMAEQLIGRFAESVKARWMLRDVYVRHRLGRVPVGDIALLIGVAAPHRHEAFEACRFLLEAIKRDAPIWKRAAGRVVGVVSGVADADRTHLAGSS